MKASVFSSAIAFAMKSIAFAAFFAASVNASAASAASAASKPGKKDVPAYSAAKPGYNNNAKPAGYNNKPGYNNGYNGKPGAYGKPGYGAPPPPVFDNGFGPKGPSAKEMRKFSKMGYYFDRYGNMFRYDRYGRKMYYNKYGRRIYVINIGGVPVRIN